MPNHKASPLCLELRARVRLGEPLCLLRDHPNHPRLSLVVEMDTPSVHANGDADLWFRYLARLPDWEIRSLNISGGYTWSYIDRGVLNVILNRRNDWISLHGRVRGEP